MKSFRQTAETHDIYLDPDSDVFAFAMADDKNAYAYIIGDAIRTVKGEIQLDTELGIPYFATVFDRSDKLNIWKHFVNKKILAYDFVTGITKFDAEIIDKDVIHYDMIVETIDGSVNVNAFDPAGSGGGGGGGGGDMGGLVQGGIFYLPVFLRNGIQVYRQLKEYNLEGVVTTELSDETYVKNGEGIFVREEV